MHKIKIAALSVMVVSPLVAWALLHRTIVTAEVDPTGRFVAEVSYRSFYSLLPMAPGSSSDKPAFVEIFAVDENKNRTKLGLIPVPMMQMAGVKWEAPGVVIPMIGECDFAKRSCFYWDKRGSNKIVTQSP